MQVYGTLKIDTSKTMPNEWDGNPYDYGDKSMSSEAKR